MDRHDNEQRMQDRGREWNRDREHGERERYWDRDRERTHNLRGDEASREYQGGQGNEFFRESGRREQNFGQGSGYQGGSGSSSGYYSSGQGDWRSREGQGYGQNAGWQDYGRQGSTFGSREGGQYYGNQGGFGSSQGGWGREYGSYGQDYPRGSSSYSMGRYNYGGTEFEQRGSRPESGQYGSMTGTGIRQNEGTYGTGMMGGSSSFGGGIGSYMGQSQGRYTGKGPKGWKRSDERIREDVNERLTDHPDIDASEIEVQVREAEVTLTGNVDERRLKRLVEDVVESVSGVREVHNQLRVKGGFFSSMGLGSDTRTENQQASSTPVGSTKTK